MKELNQNILEKGLFAAIKGHLDNPEGLVDVESP